jgi:hypothetical protein
MIFSIVFETRWIELSELDGNARRRITAFELTHHAAFGKNELHPAESCGCPVCVRRRKTSVGISDPFAQGGPTVPEGAG